MTLELIAPKFSPFLPIHHHCARSGLYLACLLSGFPVSLLKQMAELFCIEFHYGEESEDYVARGLMDQGVDGLGYIFPLPQKLRISYQRRKVGCHPRPHTGPLWRQVAALHVSGCVFHLDTEV